VQGSGALVSADTYDDQRRRRDEHAVNRPPCGSPSGTPGDPPEADGSVDHLEEDLPPELDVAVAELARNPNMKVLLALVLVILVVAIAVGIGWR
jgi:hypothetical protein